MFRIFVFTSCLRAVFFRVVHHLKRGGRKGKAERVSSVKVIKKPTEKKRPEPGYEPLVKAVYSSQFNSMNGVSLVQLILFTGSIMG